MKKGKHKTEKKDICILEVNFSKSLPQHGPGVIEGYNFSNIFMLVHLPSSKT